MTRHVVMDELARVSALAEISFCSTTGYVNNTFSQSDSSLIGAPSKKFDRSIIFSHGSVVKIAQDFVGTHTPSNDAMCAGALPITGRAC